MLLRILKMLYEKVCTHTHSTTKVLAISSLPVDFWCLEFWCYRIFEWIATVFFLSRRCVYHFASWECIIRRLSWKCGKENQSYALTIWHICVCQRTSHIWNVYGYSDGPEAFKQTHSTTRRITTTPGLHMLDGTLKWIIYKLVERPQSKISSRNSSAILAFFSPFCFCCCCCC